MGIYIRPAAHRRSIQQQSRLGQVFLKLAPYTQKVIHTPRLASVGHYVPDLSDAIRFALIQILLVAKPITVFGHESGLRKRTNYQGVVLQSSLTLKVANL